MLKKKRIAITIGDPAGIGPEVTLKALLSEEIFDLCKPLIIGDRIVIHEAIEQLNIQIDSGALDILSTGAITTSDFVKGQATAQGGAASVSYIRKAVDLLALRAVDSLVTAPITKKSLSMAKFTWPGHTEMLAEMTGTKDYAMMLCGGPLRIILVTIHTALRNVAELITREKVFSTIMLAQKACAMLGISQPRIGVAGLNPHAGEAGVFGNEETDLIAPAVREAQSLGITVFGPYPPDALFYKAYNGQFDIVVCMYHDQGLIPLKMVAFDKGVNLTVGLPFVRTSPDHGTAYDIAWKGFADPSSMIEAIKLAVRLEVEK